MRLTQTIILLVFMTFQIQAQIISGHVINASNEKPLEYVNLGIIDTSQGTVTNEKGEFSFDTKGQSSKAVVRISMIGFKAQTFSIEELVHKESMIKLIPESIQLGEVTVKPYTGKLKKVGTTDYTRRGGLCGWGGIQRGKGYEIGTNILLGTAPVMIRGLHLSLNRQSFESSLFRLHIRTIEHNLPSKELLTENILFQVTKSSGWVDVDLTNYNLVLEGDVALTIEWVNVLFNDKSKLIHINGKMNYCVLFNEKQKQGSSYTRWGSESNWTWKEGSSPVFYLTVQE